MCLKWTLLDAPMNKEHGGPPTSRALGTSLGKITATASAQMLFIVFFWFFDAF